MASVEERLKLKRGQVDTWSTREKLCLASCVARSGNQNWMSVSRNLKSFGGEPGRPGDWFSQKSCAAQYDCLLTQIETPKRKKRGADGTRSDGPDLSPAEVIVKQLTLERIEELRTLMAETRAIYRKEKEELFLIESGQADDRLNEMLLQMQEEKKQKERDQEEHLRWLRQREERKQEIEMACRTYTAQQQYRGPTGQASQAAQAARRPSNQSEISSEADSNVDSPLSSDQHQTIAEDSVEAKPTPTPTSPLLTSLLKSPSPVTGAQSTSILHSAITSQRGASPTITSLLNSSPSIPSGSSSLPVSPNLKSLVSNALAGHEDVPKPLSHSASGSPTLSMLLELPPSTPGQPLPELPYSATKQSLNTATTTSTMAANAGAELNNVMLVPSTTTNTGHTSEVFKEGPETVETSGLEVPGVVVPGSQVLYSEAAVLEVPDIVASAPGVPALVAPVVTSSQAAPDSTKREPLNNIGNMDIVLPEETEANIEEAESKLNLDSADLQHLSSADLELVMDPMDVVLEELVPESLVEEMAVLIEVSTEEVETSVNNMLDMAASAETASQLPSESSNPTSQPSSQPASVSGTQSVTRPATQPETHPPSQSSAQPVSELATAVPDEPVSESVSDPVTEPVSVPISEDVSQSDTEQDSETVTDIKPIAELDSEPISRIISQPCINNTDRTEEMPVTQESQQQQKVERFHKELVETDIQQDEEEELAQLPLKSEEEEMQESCDGKESNLETSEQQYEMDGGKEQEEKHIRKQEHEQPLRETCDSSKEEHVLNEGLEQKQEDAPTVETGKLDLLESVEQPVIQPDKNDVPVSRTPSSSTVQQESLCTPNTSITSTPPRSLEQPAKGSIIGRKINMEDDDQTEQGEYEKKEDDKLETDIGDDLSREALENASIVIVQDNGEVVKLNDNGEATEVMDGIQIIQNSAANDDVVPRDGVQMVTVEESKHNSEKEDTSEHSSLKEMDTEEIEDSSSATVEKDTGPQDVRTPCKIGKENVSGRKDRRPTDDVSDSDKEKPLKTETEFMERVAVQTEMVDVEDENEGKDVQKNEEIRVKDDKVKVLEPSALKENIKKRKSLSLSKRDKSPAISESSNDVTSEEDSRREVQNKEKKAVETMKEKDAYEKNRTTLAADDDSSRSGDQDSIQSLVKEEKEHRAETPSTEDDSTRDAEHPIPQTNKPRKGRLGRDSSAHADSVPNSPASNIISADDEKEFRAWKKSIMLVYGRIAAHKYASLFLRPITDDKAPGYSQMVYRPIDLFTIKKNIENGTIRSTDEFQRDILLMFNNAIMYNKSGSHVHNMARTMQEEGVSHLKEYVNTQLLVQAVGAEGGHRGHLPSRRGTRTAEKRDQDLDGSSVRRGIVDRSTPKGGTPLQPGKRKRSFAPDDKSTPKRRKGED